MESPEEALADRISLEEVLRALPEQDRQLIQLRFYGNRTQSETAKVLHTTQVQISRRSVRFWFCCADVFWKNERRNVKSERKNWTKSQKQDFTQKILKKSLAFYRTLC